MIYRCRYTCHGVPCVGYENFVELVLSFHQYVILGIRQAAGLTWPAPLSLGHLASPRFLNFDRQT